MEGKKQRHYMFLFIPSLFVFLTQKSWAIFQIKVGGFFFLFPGNDSLSEAEALYKKYIPGVFPHCINMYPVGQKGSDCKGHL